jgi:8-oxo-dGTP pyrophosphatase MutT (NUDIX family)
VAAFYWPNRRTKPYGEIAGGAVEADDSPYAAVVRELKEELGLTTQVGRLLVTDWLAPAGSHRGRHYARTGQSVNRYTSRMSTSYSEIASSRETSVKLSVTACATSIRSKGSRWCNGRRPAAIA